MKQKSRIFLVDDDLDITLTFQRGLDNIGFVVDAFNDPLDALLKFKKGFYDLILLDIKMPGMNGFELYQELQKIDNRPKVCFITSFVVYYETLREIFPTLKVCCFIKKPIEIDELAQRLERELE
ncbi:MAG: response regulator [Thermoproteota archaeon]|nr:response regulator [Thermoproteota archaeon]